MQIADHASHQLLNVFGNSYVAEQNADIADQNLSQSETGDVTVASVWLAFYAVIIIAGLLYGGIV
jgi:hypothetical protein